MPMIDFVIGLLQGLAFAFVVYGAFLAASGVGAQLSPGKPPVASAESDKGLVPEGSLESRPERRQRARRKADRRNGPRENLYGVPM
jgi:hypothetical protein